MKRIARAMRKMNVSRYVRASVSVESVASMASASAKSALVAASVYSLRRA